MNLSLIKENEKLKNENQIVVKKYRTLLNEKQELEAVIAQLKRKYELIQENQKLKQTKEKINSEFER